MNVCAWVCACECSTPGGHKRAYDSMVLEMTSGCEPWWGCWGSHLGSLKSNTCSLPLSQLSRPLWWCLNAYHKLWKGMDHASLTSPCSVLLAGGGIELKLMFEVLVPIPSTVGSLVPPLSSLLGSESRVVICILFTAWCRWSQIVWEKSFQKLSNAVKT